MLESEWVLCSWSLTVSYFESSAREWVLCSWSLTVSYFESSAREWVLCCECCYYSGLDTVLPRLSYMFYAGASWGQHSCRRPSYYFNCRQLCTEKVQYIRLTAAYLTTVHSKNNKVFYILPQPLLAQWWFPGLAISNAKIQIYSSDKIHGGNFIKQHRVTYYIFWHKFIPSSVVRAGAVGGGRCRLSSLQHRTYNSAWAAEYPASCNSSTHNTALTLSLALDSK